MAPVFGVLVHFFLWRQYSSTLYPGNYRLLVVQIQLYLAQVRDDQGWENNAEGGHLDGLPIEVAQVSEQGFHTCKTHGIHFERQFSRTGLLLQMAGSSYDWAPGSASWHALLSMLCPT